MTIKFDQRQLKYKSPFGAVPRGTRVRFFAETDREDVTVTLRLWEQDGEKLISGTREQSGFVFFHTPEHTGITWYFFIVDCPEGRRYYSGTVGEGRLFDSQPESYQLTVYDPDFRTPEEFQRGIVYQIFPDRFFRPGEILGIEEHKTLGHSFTLYDDWYQPVNHLPQPGGRFYTPTDFYGGNLYGIIQKLPYLKSLGVSWIYLNPVFLSSSNHRYNTADYMAVDPMLGGDEALFALASAAKRQGIRIMLDGVFSHTGDDSRYFDRYGVFGGGACSDAASPYREWYDFERYPDKYRCWWGFETLPEVNELTPSYMDFIGGVLEKYAKMGITSWRLDVADELPDEFIVFLRNKLKSLDPEGVLLGEVWEEASNKQGNGVRRRYVDGRELDGVMDYPMRTALWRFFTGQCSGEELCDSLLSLMENYPMPFYLAQLNLLSSHDTVRAVTAFGGAPDRSALSREQQAAFRLTDAELAKGRQRFMSAAAVQYTLPGVPCLYYGDEAGLCGMADPFCRGTYPWGREDGELTDYFRLLGQIRRGIANKPNCAMYGRGDIFALYHGNVLCIVNRSDLSIGVSLEDGDFLGSMRPELAGSYTDALTGERICANGVLQAVLPPTGRRILIKELE